MRLASVIPSKVYSVSHLVHKIASWRIVGKTIAFTNGVFDILHEGHIYSLSQAASEADILVVAVNSDASVKRLKGPSRPINNENSRALVLASLIMVDAVVIFEEDTPLDVITKLMPDVIVKGGDYTVEQVAGAKEAMANGGRVIINELIEGVSTTGIIEKMQSKI